MVGSGQIEEIQGLYGPFTVSERVLQKIWLRGDFATDGLRTASGKTLEVRAAGTWNPHEGPDFREARLVIGGEPVVGDVEIHFYAADWEAHGHGGNPDFSGVVLHVVLYPEKGTPLTYRRADGGEPETVYLLPLLHRDLESLVADEALLALERADELEWVALFLERPPDDRAAVLRRCAEERWEQKLRFARRRLRETGWREACHQAALEVLGYARNRAPMQRIAIRYPLAGFAANTPDEARLFAEEAGNWRLQGVRPANHPRRRLAQYRRLAAEQPDWPARVAERLRALPPADGAETARQLRRKAGLARFRRECRSEVFRDLLGEKRFDTLMIDALLPLSAAAGECAAAPYWRAWPPGDVPDALIRFLRQTRAPGDAQPMANGAAQGALALFFSDGAAA